MVVGICMVSAPPINVTGWNASWTVYTDALQLQLRYFVQSNTEDHRIVTVLSLGMHWMCWSKKLDTLYIIFKPFKEIVFYVFSFIAKLTLISFRYMVYFFFFIVRCRLVICVVPSGRWTAPSGVGRWLFHGVCFLGNFLLARCFLSLLWRGHDCRTCAVVCASSPQGQRPDYSMSIFFI